MPGMEVRVRDRYVVRDRRSIQRYEDDNGPLLLSSSGNAIQSLDIFFRQSLRGSDRIFQVRRDALAVERTRDDLQVL